MRLVLLLLLAAAPKLAAQLPRAAVGAQVGYSRSDLSGGDAEQIRSRQGALTGVYLYFPLRPGLALRPEFLFSLKGGRTEAPIVGGGTALLDIELAYLELPVLAHVSLPTGGLRPVLFGGAAPSFRIGCDLQIIVQPEPIRAPCDETFRDVDVGIVAGAGIEAQLNRSTLALLEGRYTAGLRSVLDNAQIDNRAFAILLALTF